MGCTHSMDNKKHVHCEDLQNSPDNQRHHALPVPLSPLPPEPPLLTSSHASSEVCKVATSTSCDEPPSCSMGGTTVSMMVLSASQKEMKESLDKQDSRAGGLACPDKTSEWSSLKEAGIGDCLKSPTMGH